MITTCELCLERPVDAGCSRKERMPICKKCHADRVECREFVKGDSPLKDRDASALCTRCGVCCFMLSAVVTAEEVQRIAEWSGRLPTDISMLEEGGPNKGELVFKRPCIFLLGKPLRFVQCRAYSMDRPAVCGSYLCKLAVFYKVGFCTLNEALFLLREAFLRGDPTIFNWTKEDDDERNLMMQQAEERARESIRKRGVEDENIIDMMIVDTLLPNYELISSVHKLALRGYLKMVDEDSIDPELFWSIDEFTKMTPGEYDVAVETMERTLKVIRDLFEPCK